jgi:hypothetical protein
MRYPLSLFLVLCLGGCGSGEVDASAPANPFAAYALPSELHTWRQGEVIERVSAGPYVYLRLREIDGRSSWLVSLRATTPSADHVRALVVGQAERFHSRRLGREFSPLSFVAVRSAAP